MAYDEARKVAEAIDKKNPGKSAREIVNDLQKEFPENIVPHPRTVSDWRKAGWPPRKVGPSVKQSAKSSVQPHQRLLRTHHSRDVAKAIDVYLKHMKHRAQYAPDPPLKVPTLRFHPEPDFYQRAIIATIEQNNAPFAECIRRFDEAVDGGDRQMAGEILKQLEKGLMTYTTMLR